MSTRYILCRITVLLDTYLVSHLATTGLALKFVNLRNTVMHKNIEP